MGANEASNFRVSQKVILKAGLVNEIFQARRVGAFEIPDVEMNSLQSCEKYFGKINRACFELRKNGQRFRWKAQQRFFFM